MTTVMHANPQFEEYFDPGFAQAPKVFPRLLQIPFGFNVPPLQPSPLPRVLK